MDIAQELARMADPSYRAFQAKLMPTVDSGRILGVRMPAVRRLARTIVKTPDAETFLAAPLPHATYDEMNLHGALIGLVAHTPSEAFRLLERFLPHIDNWATCDLIKVPAFKQDLPATLTYLRGCMKATGAQTEYVVRFGIVQLMELFLDDAFEPEQLCDVAAIDRPEYYINMARAWYFSYALIKQPEATLPLFITPTIDAWTHNKSLQKACESRRTSPDQKAYLRSLKVKA